MSEIKYPQHSLISIIMLKMSSMIDPFFIISINNHKLWSIWLLFANDEPTQTSMDDYILRGFSTYCNHYLVTVETTEHASWGVMSCHIITFIFILWILTGLQNPQGYGNSHICLRSLEVKSI